MKLNILIRIILQPNKIKIENEKYFGSIHHMKRQ